jgi:hypothetical protein
LPDLAVCVIARPGPMGSLTSPVGDARGPRCVKLQGYLLDCRVCRLLVVNDLAALA